MNAWIYLLSRSPRASGRVSFPVVALLWNGVAWSLKAPHMRPPNRAAWCTSHTMEWEREGKWFGSYWRGWSSRFKAVCLAEALTGLLSALDVRPVMSLWRVRAVLAGRLRLHCTGVGVRPSKETCKSVASTGLWCCTQGCSSRLDWNVLIRKPQCDEGTAAVSRLDVHTHTRMYITAEGSVDVCVP